MKHIYSFLALALILFATSCTKLNLDEAHSQGYNASLAAPICKFHSSIFEILNKVDTAKEVKIDSINHSLHFYWKGNEQDIPIDLVKIDSGQTVSRSIDITDNETIQQIIYGQQTAILSKGEYTFQDNLDYKFKFNKYEPGVKEHIIDSILFAKANLFLSVNYSGLDLGKNSRIELNINIPSITNPEKRDVNAIISKSPMDINRVLTRFVADLSEVINDTNILHMTFTYKIISDGTASISQGARLNYTTQFYPLVHDVVYGSFWQAEAVYDTIVGVKMPEGLRKIANDQSRLMFHDPKLTLYLQNNVGADVKYVIDSIWTLDKDGNILNYADFNGTKTLTNYLHQPDEPHEVGYDTIMLDRNNGKTNELFCPMPDSIALACHVYVGKKNGNHSDFFINPINVHVKLNMHMEATLDAGSYYCTTDTMKADIAGSSKDFADKLKIQELHIMLLTMSSLPCNATASFYMLDSNNVQIYELEDVLIEAAEVDEYGAAISTTNQEIELVFEGPDIDAILQTKKMCLKVFVDGKDVESMISIHADNALDAEVSAFAKFKANLDNLFK